MDVKLNLKKKKKLIKGIGFQLVHCFLFSIICKGYCLMSKSTFKMFSVILAQRQSIASLNDTGTSLVGIKQPCRECIMEEEG